MKIIKFAIFVLTVLLVPSLALADDHKQDQCKTDSNCEKGMICVEVTHAESTVVTVSTDCVCPEGEENCDCDKEPQKPEADPPPAKKVKRCVPKNCNTNNDCGDSKLKCVSVEKDCDDVAISAPPAAIPCPDGEDCEKTETQEPQKTEAEDCETVKICVPKWMGPCKTDSDCGQGTTCECKCEEPGQTSSGSSSSGGQGAAPTPNTPGTDDAPDGGEDSADSTPAPEPGKADSVENCDCGIAQCRADKVDCKSNSDCKNGWTCQEDPTQPKAGVTICAEEEPASDGEICEDETKKPEVKKYCLPSNFKAWFMALISSATASSSDATLAGGSKDGSTTAANAPSSDQDESFELLPGERNGGAATGCQSGSSPMTLLPLFMLVAILAIMRRRASTSEAE